MAANVASAIAAISPDRLRQHVLALEGVRHPVVDPAALRRAETYVHQHLQETGLQVVDHTFMDGGEPHQNIVGTLPGANHSSESILLMAHLDTIAGSPGADDNASGVASVLEIARALAGFRFARTIRFVGVNLEERKEGSEDFLRGTRALLEVIRKEAWNIRAVIDLEMVGFASDTTPQHMPAGLPVVIPKQGNFVAVVANQASQHLMSPFVEASRTHSPALPVVPLVVPGRGEMLPDVRRSDHSAFWDAGIPALMITDTSNFRNPHYHEPTDTADTLNFSFMAEVARAAAGAVVALAS